MQGSAPLSRALPSLSDSPPLHLQQPSPLCCQPSESCGREKEVI